LASDAAENDAFGFSVAVTGETLEDVRPARHRSSKNSRFDCYSPTGLR
jgi:hypothetical protein